MEQCASDGEHQGPKRHHSVLKLAYHAPCQMQIALFNIIPLVDCICPEKALRPSIY